MPIMEDDDLFATVPEPPVSRAEKLKELDREIAMRQGVYPRWVDQGKLTRKVADRRIRILEAIREDYVRDNPLPDVSRET